ncbi:ependymin-like [Megalops cyprinoides]|uniref:ependymin-like n=1 Tax=Megalops cyprinoides TaxID=118141 RepID=UPI0018656038|nr:ependymin-like [Megalops cyprinoides]
MRVLLVCLVLAVTTWAQRPKHCTSPPLLVGSLSVLGPKSDLGAYGKYTYDALGRRVRFFEVGSYKNQSFQVDLLMLFAEGVLYEINWQNHTCTKKALKDHFQPMEVPKNATLLGQVILGSSSGFGQGLLVNTWSGEVPETEAKYMSTFTEFGCLPVSTLYHTEETGGVIVSFFNILIGIDDPQVFFPPPFCQSAQLVGTTDFFGAFF